MFEGKEIKFTLRNINKNLLYEFDGFIAKLDEKGLMIYSKNNNPIFCIKGMEYKLYNEIIKRCNEYFNDQIEYIIFECSNHKIVSSKEILEKCPFKQ